jgi:hypothetical protein
VVNDEWERLGLRKLRLMEISVAPTMKNVSETVASGLSPHTAGRNTELFPSTCSMMARWLSLSRVGYSIEDKRVNI